MTLNYRVKFIQEKNLGLEEIVGVKSIVFGNLENGNFELYRVVDKEKADLPYFAIPWQKIADFKTEERGTFSKKTILNMVFQNDKGLELELQEKIEPKSLLTDYIAFKNNAEKDFPKGANEKAVESLTKVSEALGEAFGRGLNKAKLFGKDLKKKVNKELEKQKK